MKDEAKNEKGIYWSHHLGLVMGKKPEGDKGNIPGERGGCCPGPKIPDCPKGEKGKLGVKGDGNWMPGESSGG